MRAGLRCVFQSAGLSGDSTFLLQRLSAVNKSGHILCLHVPSAPDNNVSMPHQSNLDVPIQLTVGHAVRLGELYHDVNQQFDAVLKRQRTEDVFDRRELFVHSNFKRA